MVDRRKAGLKSKVIILQYSKDHTNSTVEISSDSSSSESDSGSIQFII